MNMREAFKAVKPDGTEAEYVLFFAGFTAAIEAVKAGMPRYFYHPVTGAEIGPCYKLPEDV